MAEYSSPADVKDDLLAEYSIESDHAESEREINRELQLRGISPAAVDAEALKELSVNFALFRRCLYSKKSGEDSFAVKQDDYRKAYADTLVKITVEYAKGTVNKSGGTIGIPVERG